MATELHKPWVTAAATKGLVRFEAAKVTVKDVPNKGDRQEIPFQAASFVLESEEDAAALWALVNTSRPVIKGEDGHPDTLGDNPLSYLITYAYGLNCRTKVRAQYESRFEDPDKAFRKIAEALVKAGQFRSFDKALAAARLMRESDEE